MYCRYTVVYCIINGGIQRYIVIYCGILWYTVIYWVYFDILWYTVIYCGIL